MGHLFGRLQRYVNDVKSDISREMELDELRKLQQEVKSAATDIEQSMQRGRARRRVGIEVGRERTQLGGHGSGAARDGAVTACGCRFRAGARAAGRPRRRTAGRVAARGDPAGPPGQPARLRPHLNAMADPTSTEAQETFLSHLVELRDRLLRAIIAIVVVLLGLFPWAKEIYNLLAKPLLAVLPQGSSMIATDVTGTFLVPLKVTALAAFVIALPYVLWQAWAFVAPGLYHHEKRLAVPVIMSSFFFFLVGMAFAYFVVFPVAFGFFAAYTPDGVQMMTDIDKYLSFVITMFIAFGLTFEVPVVVIVLVRLRMVTIEKLKAARPYVIVGAFVIGAIFTPPDVVSQLLLAIPLWLLYELGIVLARFIGTGPTRADADAEETPG